MRLSILAATLILALPATVLAQEAVPPAPGPAPAEGHLAPSSPDRVSDAEPADVATPEAIVAALYDVISGDAGVQRDWDRFRSLFHPTARLVPTGVNPAGQGALRVLTPDQYITNSGSLLVARGFHEREIARQIELFGSIAHVWSTYDTRHSLSDAKAFARGINSIQLFHDGTRWWVVSVYWQSETSAAQLPSRYLPPSD